MVLFLIPFYHLSNYNFWSYSYPNFPPVVAGLDKGNFFGFSFSTFMFRSVLGVWLSHQSWFPPHLTGFFWEGYEFDCGHSIVGWCCSLPYSYFDRGCDGKVGNWLIIWIECFLFNFHTLGITVTAKSHWFPQLLPIIY